jgi:hypothetical protein
LFGREAAAAEIAPVTSRFRLLNRDRGGARESLLRQKACAQARHTPPARAILDHLRIIDAAHHLAAGSVVFGNPERLARLLRIERQ